MRNYSEEIEKRVAYIKEVLKKANKNGIVFGNSGGKDSVLVGILCKKACDNTVGIIMPCSSKQNYNEDKLDAEAVAKKFMIDTRFVSLTETKETLESSVKEITTLNQQAITNIAPRLRMTTLYMIAASEDRLVAGTGNKSETYMGYFTKWGDGAYDFNPIADLSVTEIFEFLKFLDAPDSIVNKAPSAGLFEGQTDEKDMGVSYATIDKYISGEKISEADQKIIDRYHAASEHKRNSPQTYK